MIKKQFFRFIIIGSFSTIVNYSFFFILYEFLSIYYIFASGIGFILGVFSSYSFNKSWTFQIEKNKSYVFRYLTIYSLSLLIGLVFLNFLVEILVIMPLLGNLLTIGLTTILNFLGSKFLVFKN